MSYGLVRLEQAMVHRPIEAVLCPGSTFSNGVARPSFWSGYAV